MVYNAKEYIYNEQIGKQFSLIKHQMIL